jgi:hypothetical protein
MFWFGSNDSGSRRSSERERERRVRYLLLALGLLLLLALLGSRGLGDQDGVDVGKDTALSDGNTTEELVQLFVVAHGQLDVAGDDAGLLVVAGGVAGKLKNLGSEVLKDGSQVDGGAGTNAGGELALSQVAADSADRELKTSLAGLALGLLAVALSTSGLAALAGGRRGGCCCCCCFCHFVRLNKFSKELICELASPTLAILRHAQAATNKTAHPRAQFKQNLCMHNS